MKKSKWCFVFLFFMTASFAQASLLPQNKNDYCSRFSNQESVRIFSQEAANLLSFKNDGGLFNGGVCWWHSRFQRNLLYLAIFRPDLPKPEKRLVRNIIRDIRKGQNVITIPGFYDVEEFSTHYSREIQAELEDWQLSDGILGAWIDGIQGDTITDPEKLKSSLDVLFDYVETKQKIAYQKLQIKGITSHSWLVMGLRKMAAGYEVGFVDSNSPKQCQNYSYKFGDTSFFIKGYGNFVPYLGFTREEERLLSVGKTFCGLSLKSKTTADQWDRDYELDLEEMKNVH